MAETAKRKNPEIWERAKAKAKRKMGGKWSGRAAQQRSLTTSRWGWQVRRPEEGGHHLVVGRTKIGGMLGRKAKGGIYRKLRGILSRLDRKQRVREQRTKPPKGAKTRLVTLKRNAKQLDEQQRNE